ncbi:MAG: GNAT family N-acetyltransferase [Spirochaetaceae bacterium]
MLRMQTATFADPIVFSDLVLPVLKPFEAENNLALGVLSTIRADPARWENPLMAVVHDGSAPTGDRIAAVVVRTPPFPVIVAYTETASDPAVVERVIQLLKEVYGTKITGFNMDTRIASPYVEAWSADTGTQASVHMRMRIYRCARVNPLSPVPGFPRTPVPGDADLLRTFVTGFYRDALPQEYSAERVDAYVRRMLTADPLQQGVLLWEVNGEVVSMAAYSGPTPHGIRVNAVYTPPEYRSHGYASACVAELTRRLLSGGREFCFLFTDLTNPTSNKIYQDIGYEPVSDHVYWRFEEGP